MEEVRLLVGIGSDDWDFDEVVFTGELVEERGGRALYRLEDGRHVMYVEAGKFRELQLVNERGYQEITLDEALGLDES